MGLELVSKEAIDEMVSRQVQMNENTPVYTGTEHRTYMRRTKADRREFLRFEANADRRNGKDRRVAMKLFDGRVQ